MPKLSRLELTARHAGDPIDLDEFKRKSWPGITAEQARIAPMSLDFAFKGSANLIVLMNIFRKDGETIVDGHSRSTVKDLRNKLSYIPAGSSVSGWSEISRPATYTAVYFDQAIDENAKPPAIPPTIAFEDHMLRSTMMAFSGVLRDSEVDVDGYSETLGALLVYELNRLDRRWKQPLLREGGLAPEQVQKVIDYIEGHLDDKITVANLSELVDLSRFHFIRAFKKSTGIPPHQFILRRRVERAKEMLLDNRVSVTEVALATGFNGLTQLTRVFRQVVGVTPTTFRRDTN